MFDPLAPCRVYCFLLLPKSQYFQILITVFGTNCSTELVQSSVAPQLTQLNKSLDLSPSCDLPSTCLAVKALLAEQNCPTNLSNKELSRQAWATASLEWKTCPFPLSSPERKLTVVASLTSAVQICCQGNRILSGTHCQGLIKNGNIKEAQKQTPIFFYTIISAGPFCWQVSLLKQLPTRVGVIRKGRVG